MPFAFFIHIIIFIPDFVFGSKYCLFFLCVEAGQKSKDSSTIIGNAKYCFKTDIIIIFPWPRTLLDFSSGIYFGEIYAFCLVER